MKGIDIDKAIEISKKASSLASLIEGIKPELDTVINFMPEVLYDMLQLLEEMKTVLPQIEKTQVITNKTLDLIKDEREAGLKEILSELNKNLLHLLEGFAIINNNLELTQKAIPVNETPIVYKKEAIVKEVKIEKQVAPSSHQISVPPKAIGANNLIRDF